MKIGLIGINRYAKYLNFACNLHIYAFQKFLANNGYDSRVLNYKPVYYNNFDMRDPATHYEANLAALLAQGRDDQQTTKLREKAEGYRSVAAEREVRYDKFEKFVADNLKFTDEEYDSDKLEVQDPGFDTYICVTDVIWSSVPTHDFDRGFLLGSKAFDGKQKISYAASRGASKSFTSEQKRQFFDYISDIDSISVREKDFEEYIEQNSALEVETVLDPVMLHDKEFWSAVSAKPAESKYLLLYYVMEKSTDTIAKAVEYARLHDLTIVEMSDRPVKDGLVTATDVKHIARYDVGLDEWLGYIEHADAVFTNSFHGCCFSVLFQKDFYVGARNGQKVPNFLRTFGLTHQQFAPNVDVKTLVADINYDDVQLILKEKRAHSENFILEALKQAEHNIATGVITEASAYEQRRRAVTFPATFNSGTTKMVKFARQDITPSVTDAKELKSGRLEHTLNGFEMKNTGDTIVPAPRFKALGRKFIGWNVRILVDNRWLWLTQDGTVKLGSSKVTQVPTNAAAIPADAPLPHIPVNRIRKAVFVARWKRNRFFFL